MRSSCFSGLLFLRRFGAGTAVVLAAARFGAKGFGEVGTDEDAICVVGWAGAILTTGRAFASLGCCVIIIN